MKNENFNLFTDGIVETKGREFTRLIGGFENGNPMFVIWQTADLLGQSSRETTQNFNNNKEEFQEGIDYIDLKSAINGNDSENNVDVTGFLKEVGYSQNKLNATKEWLAFSFSGLLKMIKIVKTKESWNLYDKFLEDYFKTKAEVRVLKVTLQEEIDKLNNDLAFLIGLGIIEKDMNKRRDLRLKEEEINQRIKELEKQLIEELTAEKYKVFEEKYKTFMDNEGCFTFEDTAKILSTRAEEDKVNIKLNRVTLPKLLREKEILSKEKKGDTFKNLPRSGYEKYFNTNPQDISVISKKGEQMVISKTQTRVNKLGLDFIYDLLVQKVS